jgi:hypothetical protein
VLRVVLAALLISEEETSMAIETFLAAYTAAALIAFAVGLLYGKCPPQPEKPKAPEPPPGVILIKPPTGGAS